MNQTESFNDTKEAVFWAAPVLFGLLLLFMGAGVTAALISGYTISQESPVIYTPLVIGSTGASLWGARRAENHRLFMGLLVGAIMLGCLLLLGWSIRSQPFTAQAVGTVCGVILCSSLIGAVCGAAGRKKKKRK